MILLIKGILMTDSEKIKAYEAMRENVIERFNTASDKMVKLKAEGKEKSVTYKQLMAEKMTMQKIMSMYDIFGIE